MAISNVSSVAIDAFSAQQQSTSQKSSQDSQQSPLAVLQRNISSTNTQLSAFSKVKLSLEDIQAKAQALQNFQKSPNLSDLKVVVLGFVQAFNTLNTTVTKVTQKQETPVNDTRPPRTLAEVSRAVAGPNNEPSQTTLEKLGITLQKDGTLAVDEQKLEKAFQADQSGTVATLASLGQRVEQAAGQQLIDKGGVGAKATDVAGRASELEKLNSDLQRRQEAQKQTMQSQAAQLAAVSGTSETSAHNAVATYVGVSSL